MDFDDLMRELGPSEPDRPNPFSHVVADEELAMARSDRPRFGNLDNLANELFVNGAPRAEVNGHPIDWHVGLEAFCRTSSRDVFGEIAGQHFQSGVELFRLWDDLEGSEYCEPMYRSPDTPIGDPFARGAFLCPSLDIPNRERLSDHFINAVLRPYAQTEIALRRLFFQSIGTSHENKEWIGFRPFGNGTFIPILPSAGFDGKGSYSIDRRTYLKGFGFSEQEFGTENFRHREPYPDQENWLFLSAELGLLQALNGTSPATNGKIGRPLGSGYDDLDLPFINEGVEMVRSGTVNSATAAARTLMMKYRDDIAGGGTEESVVTRLRRKISKALGNKP